MKKVLSARCLLAICALAVAAILFLSSRGQGEEKSPGEVGRYQLSTCTKEGFFGVYVIDTRTGVVKFINDEEFGKPFAECK